MFQSGQSVDKPQILFFCGGKPHFVFPATGASKKLLVSEKPLVKRLFKGTGVVLAGIECSPKIFNFRANGILVQERVDFFDTLTALMFQSGFVIKICGQPSSSKTSPCFL